MESPIRLENVSLRFGRHIVLNNITAEFPHGTVTALLGRSGSGKTSLLHLMNGTTRPDSGKVFLNGHAFDYSRGDLLRQNMGYVVQHIGLFPHLTIRENILMSVRIQNKNPDLYESRMAELMERVHLPAHFQHQYPNELSGGEQQRVGLCRALIHEPEMILMDEPLGALDPLTRREVQQEILGLQQREPRCVILVTHDPSEAFRLADRVMIIDGGNIVQYADKSDVFSNPATPFVQELLSMVV